MAEATNKFSFVAADEAATLRCAAWVAQALVAHMADSGSGMLVSLEGDLGAGKTAFARGLIQARCGPSTLVPSPSFALVQPYEETQPPIWHADLYRLGEASEVEELGLMDALAAHICLVEWADKADGLLPEADMIVRLQEDGAAARHIDMFAPPTIISALHAAAARDQVLSDFLSNAGWAAASRAALAGDASTRRYERLSLDGQKAVLMDWAKGPDGPAIYDGLPYSRVAHLAEAMPGYCRMVDWLGAHGLRAPGIFSRDEAQGFALMQDFGDRHIANEVTLDRAVFYFEAVETLLHLHRQEAADFLPPYDGAVQAVEAGLFLDWFLPWRGIEVSDVARHGFLDFWREMGDKLAADKPVTVLRDYHSVNLLWRETAQARFRIGLIDVQDALAGHAAYDLASLLCDARVDVAPELRAQGLAHYMQARFGDDAAARADFEAAVALCTAQRNFKIAGIFIRLAERDKKPDYLRHVPRVLGYLENALAHEALAPMAAWLAENAPHLLDANILEPQND